jgi:heme ABC exporter ATP-binding subunit CcmA
MNAQVAIGALEGYPRRQRAGSAGGQQPVEVDGAGDAGGAGRDPGRAAPGRRLDGRRRGPYREIEVGIKGYPVVNGPIVVAVTDGALPLPDSGSPPAATPAEDRAGERFEPLDTTVLQLEGAISLINRFPALAGVDLTVSKGQIVLLRGPNGAGKSTLLRLCAGLAPLNEGSGVVLGHDLGNRRQRRELRHQTGLLAHDTFLYDELTVEENLLFWARANRIDVAAVEPVLDRLALSNRLRHVRVAHLSAGQRRRTSLAVLVVRRPRLWLLDEPHAGLDVNGRDFVDNLIKHAIAFGATVMFASHDYDRATDIATRTVIIAGGQIQGDQPDATVVAPWVAPAGRSAPRARRSAAGGPSWIGDAADDDAASSSPTPGGTAAGGTAASSNPTPGGSVPGGSVPGGSVPGGNDRGGDQDPNGGIRRRSRRAAGTT